MDRVHWHSVSFHRDATAFIAGGFFAGLLVAVSTGQWWQAVVAAVVLYFAIDAWRTYRRFDMDTMMPAAGLPKTTFVAFGTEHDPDSNGFRRNLTLIEFGGAVSLLVTIAWLL